MFAVIKNNKFLIFHYLLFKGQVIKFLFLINKNRRTYIDPTARIIGVKNIEIGDYTLISEDVWININHRVGKEKKLIIGKNCHIGKGNFISVGPKILIKDFCFTGLNCNILGCGHSYDNPFIPYKFSSLTDGKEIEIGVNCWLATSVIILEGVKIGHGSVIGTGTIVKEDIPPFSLVIGNPSKVIKRFDFKLNKWINISTWNIENENSIIEEDTYLELLNRNYHQMPISYITSGKRFGWV